MFLYAATIGLSAFLLFLVQPVIAKQILPWFGGSAAVWTTCMVFFQLLLLAGYFYSDLVIRKLDLRRQAMVHTVLLIASLAFLPIVPSEAFKPADPGNPIGKILLLLLLTIGLPYLMLSTTGPLVQAWFSKRYRQGRVYRLYALSNVASMVALIAYPPLIEPFATNRVQSIGWSIGYALFAVLAALSAWSAVRSPAPLPADAADPLRAIVTKPPTLAQQGLWLVLAALGSVLLLAVTNHITQNIASIPFLWVLPLAIYLVTFILCFDGSGWYWRRSYPVLAAAVAVLLMAALEYRLTDSFKFEQGIMHLEHAVPLYGLGLFVLCMFAHGELVARKPQPAHLTRFYLMVSLGGAVGGLLVGVVAPLTLDWYWEFPLALTLAAAATTALAPGHLKWLGAAATLGCIALFVNYSAFVREDTIEISRNFYGTLRVKATAPDSDKEAKWRLLHGVITHGEQFRAPEYRDLATTYYGETSGVGRAIDALRDIAGEDEPQKIGLIGLGVGTLASYGRKGDTYRIYELNPSVLDLARRRFTYLGDSEASIDVPLGDARLVLEREAPQQFDLLAIDAFSSDSIPVHLINREAVRLYRRHIKPDGVIAFHISNRYLDLAGITRQLADDVSLQAIRVVDEPADDTDVYRSDWILITGNAALANRLLEEKVGELIEPDKHLRPWTDDHNNLFQVLKLK